MLDVTRGNLVKIYTKMTMGIETKQVGQKNDYANSNRYLRMKT